MIGRDGHFDWMEFLPGPRDKTWPDVNENEGVIFHSAVGTLAGVINIVFGPISNQRSVTGVVAQSGRTLQFYDVKRSPWANGNRECNRRFLGFEFEGGPPGNESEPLTEAQIDRALRILKDLSHFKGVGYGYWQRQASLWEHNEMTRFGASPTACPSGRIPWDEIIQRLADSEIEDEDMPAIIENPTTPGFDTYFFEAKGVYRKMKDSIEREGEAALHNLPFEPRKVRREVWAYITDGKEPQA